MRNVVVVAAVVMLSGCHSGVFLQDYTVVVFTSHKSPGGTDSVPLDATWTRTRSCLGYAGEDAWYGFPVIGPQTRNTAAARVSG